MNSNNNQQQTIAVQSKKSKAVWISVFVLTTIALLGVIITYMVMYSSSSDYGVTLEDVYQKSYYNLSSDVETAENEMSKLLASSASNGYAKKLIRKIATSADSAQNNVSYLPLSADGVSDSVSFLNKLYGYMVSLETKLNSGETLSSSEVDTLTELHKSLQDMKSNLSRITEKFNSGYSIVKNSSRQNGDYNNFTTEMKNIKASDKEYPSMIYDGPFSDSTLNKKIKGLNIEQISQENALKVAENLFENYSVDGEPSSAKGKFDTYSYVLKSHDQEHYLYASLTTNGAKLLALSGQNIRSEKMFSKEQAEDIAKTFVQSCGLKNMQVVWSDEVGNNAFFNFAPKENGIILYPDLVKVKVDLTSCQVVGYEASSYYTNHTNRTLPNTADLTIKAPSGYIQKTSKLCLAPLDYGREVLCQEIYAVKDGNEYYFYYNAVSGELENVLKVIKTNNGNLLM